MTAVATFLGFPLNVKTVSLATLTLQNSLLTVLLHSSLSHSQSRHNGASGRMYSAATAVLLNEVLKGTLSFGYAVGTARLSQAPKTKRDLEKGSTEASGDSDLTAIEVARLQQAVGSVVGEIFSGDCFKLAIPACLYVFQNNLQFIAASHLDVPTFQVTYNLKILTTALFSVALLRRRLSARKWLALLILAAGVGVVQAQAFEIPNEMLLAYGHTENRLKGLVAVAVACCTSGLAGVYLEKVIKGSPKVDLSIRNCQLAIFSVIPALLPVLVPSIPHFSPYQPLTPAPPRQSLFAHFGPTIWAVVLCQALGGILTSLVIKHSDNVAKGFATSISILVSFIAGIFLFSFKVTPAFVAGALWVILATYLYSSREYRPSSFYLTAPPLQHHSIYSPSISSTRTFRPPFTEFGPTPPSPPSCTTPPPTTPTPSPSRRASATLCEPHTPEVSFGFGKSTHDEFFSPIVSVHGMIRTVKSSSTLSSMESEDSWVPLGSPEFLGDDGEVRRMV
ncbi:solute carrier family 35 (UDP-sugar transporter), member A1/2/3, partial [Phenoliferia sp. Uapishka_3]